MVGKVIDRHERLDLFAMLPVLRLKVEPELEQIDELLGDDSLYEQVKADLCLEGRISVLKRRGHLGRCRDHGEEGFERWVGWGILSGNLSTIARSLAKS